MSTALTTGRYEADRADPPAPETTAIAPVSVPQFARGFEGMATEPFPEAARRVLAEPINPNDVEIKPDGIVFLPGVAWRRILIRAFGAGGWAIAPRGPSRVMGNVVIYHGALFALGRFVGEAVGECFYREGNANMSYASCVEGARTDCIGRIVKDLGYGAEMWDANWREAWKAKYAVQEWGKKWDARKQAEVPTQIWKLKNRVSNVHDLMAGAGGVAPPAAPMTSAASSTSKPPVKAIESAPIAGADGTEPSPAASSSTDTGEAATDEQKARVKALIKAAEWKAGYVKMWFSSHFQINTHDARECVDALTSKQADTVILLLSCDMADYDKLLTEMKARGECT